VEQRSYCKGQLGSIPQGNLFIAMPTFWQPLPDLFTSTHCNRHTRFVNSDSSFRPAQPLPRAAAAPLLREAEALLVTEAAAPGQQDAVHATLQRLALAERLGEADATLLLSALWHQASTVLPSC